jgi:serine/threonine protein kinase
MAIKIWLVLLCSIAWCSPWKKELEDDRVSQSAKLRELSTEVLLTSVDTFSDAQGRYRPVFTVYQNRTCRPEHFRKLRKLGSGSQGKVWQAQHDSGLMVALKMIRDKGPPAYKRIRAEEVFLARLHHVSIPQLYCSYQENGLTVLAMTLVDARDLFDWIYEQKLFPRLTQRVMTQLVNVLGYLHANNVLHRDVKPENIMMTKTGHMYLVDFDHAIMTDKMASGNCGTLMNMAPEILRNESYDNGIDWYAAGLVLYEMVTGAHPYDYIKERSLMLARAMEGCPKTGDRLVDDLVSKLSHVQLRRRWSVANGNWHDISTHPYLLDAERTRNVRIDKLRRRRARR